MRCLRQIHDMNAQFTLATQKQLRLDAAIAQQKADLKGLQVR